MSEAPLDLLLNEARTLYKAESDRYGQLYGRMGVYLAVFAIYTNALVWFFESGLSAERGNVVFVLALVALFALTVLGFGNLLLALWGKKVSAQQGPTFWRERRDALRQPVFDQLAAEGTAGPTEDQVEQRVTIALKEDLVDDLARCTELNGNLNERRFGYLHRASEYAGVGFVLLLFLVGAFVYTVWAEPPRESPVTRVRVLDRVKVDLNTHR